MDPFLRIVLVVLLAPYCLARHFLGESRVGLQLIQDRWVLTRCPDAVGENVSGSIVVLAPESGGVFGLVDDCSWCHGRNFVCVNPFSAFDFILKQ